MADAASERVATEERLKATEERMHELEAKLEEEGRESSDLELLRQRLREEMEDERKQHQQDLAERDFTADQTRKKYQSKLQFHLMKRFVAEMRYLIQLSSLNLAKVSTTQTSSRFI